MTDENLRPAPPPADRLTRAEWLLIAVLALIQFTHIVDFVIIMPLGERLMRELSISPAQFSFVVAAYGIAAAVTSLLAAAVIDRFDRRPVLLTLYAGFGVSTLLCGLAPTYEWLLASRALAGAFGGLAAAAIMAVIGDVFPDARRGRASGAVMSAFAVASIAGLPAGLKIAAAFGRGAPFVALAGLCVGVWIVAAFVLPSLTSHRRHRRAAAGATFAAVVREPAHLWAFAFTFCLVIGTFTVASFIGPVFTANAGLTESDLATVYAAAGAFTLLVMAVMGRLADRYDRLGLFRLVAGMTVVMTLVITNVTPSAVWVGCAFAALFMGTASGRMVPAQAMLVGVAPPHLRGGFLSVNTAMQHVATGVAPLIAGALMVKTADGRLEGYPEVGAVAAAAAVLALVLAGRLRPAGAARALPKREAVDVVPEPMAV